MPGNSSDIPAAVKGFVVSDVEGTLTDGVMWQAIFDYLGEHGRGNERKPFLRRHLWSLFKWRLKLVDPDEFRNRWIADQARLLAGMPLAEIETLCEWIVEHDFWPKRRQTPLAELAEWQAGGARLILASGLYEPIVASFARRFTKAGEIIVIGTPLRYQDGGFSGEFAAPICNGLEKARRVQAELNGETPLATYGDTPSDIPMLQLSRQPVVVNPQPEFAAYARGQSWRIIE